MVTKFLISEQEIASDAPPLEVMNPWDQSTVVGSCYCLTESQCDTLFDMAQEGYEIFQKSRIAQRAAILMQLAKRLEQEQQALAQLITLESGKPIKLSRVEVQRAVDVCQGYANLLDRYEEHWVYTQDRKALVKRFPYGPILAITPFNFPLNLVVHKVAPAIALGTSITVKPSPKTPLTALFLGSLLNECGYPYMNVVPCSNELTQQLAQSGVFKKISFTGSADVGWELSAKVSPIPMGLELGSNSACIVDDIAYGVDAIAKRCVESAFAFGGQSCISLQRLYVHEFHYEEMMQALLAASKKIRVGNPIEDNTDVGPLIDLDAIKRTRQRLRDAVEKGGNIVLGGTTFNSFTYNPTILNRTTPDMLVMAEEVFAPLMVVEPYDDLTHVITQVNQSRYGLHAGIYTSHEPKLNQAFKTLQVGGVVHNDTPTTRLDYLPYGGVKESGWSREGVMSGLDEMSYIKTLICYQA